MGNCCLISIIACVGSDGALGFKNELLFNIKKDLKFFQDNTKGNLCVMGRKTFDSIIEMNNGKPLSNRISCILTRDQNYESKYGEIAYNSVDRIINHYKTMGDSDKKVFICGGEAVYLLFMEFADELLITHVNKHVEESDAHFPIHLIAENDFVVAEESEEYYTEKYDAYYKFVRYVKDNKGGKIVGR